LKANDGRPRVGESMHIISRDEARRAHRRVLAAGIAGNVMEWYDFAVYGYFARTIGRLYFPTESQTASLLAAFGVFAVGFLMRPLGAVIFGHIGDRVGRGPALLLSVIAMAVPTFAIGLLPTYAEIGAAASTVSRRHGHFLVVVSITCRPSAPWSVALSARYQSHGPHSFSPNCRELHEGHGGSNDRCQ